MLDYRIYTGESHASHVKACARKAPHRHAMQCDVGLDSTLDVHGREAQLSMRQRRYAPVWVDGRGRGRPLYRAVRLPICNEGHEP
jgi:hypothetical protein